MSPAPARGDAGTWPHRTGPRDLAFAASSASLAGMMALMPLLTVTSAHTPDPAPAAALPVTAA